MAKQRIVSLDMFRGIAMILMILVNNPGDWGNVYAPLLHAEWHGWTPTDLVFPFFVIAMGMAMPFGSTENSGITTDQFIKILARTLRLICLGLFLVYFSKIKWGEMSGIPLMTIRLIASALVGYGLLGNFSAIKKLIIAASLFILFIGLAFSGLQEFETVRIPGVLQRLGTIYFFSVIIFALCSFRTQFIISAVVLIGYYVLLTYVPVPGTGATGYEINNNLAAWVDQVVLGKHVWATSKTWDPEGVLSTLPAIISCLIGAWAGKLLKMKADIKNVLYIGLALFICGLIWDNYFPINKALWTSSLVLLTAGLGFILVSILSILFDNKPSNAVSEFMVMWGVNPIIVFFGAGILPRALNMIKINDKAMLSSMYKNSIVPLFENPMNASLTYAILNVVFWSLVLLYLKRINLIIKV